MSKEYRASGTRDDRPTGNAKFLARRNEIVDLAAELFARNGYAATGIRELGEAASLARGALYYYIGSKESLLSEIHDRVMDPLLEETNRISGLDASAEARIRMISDVLLHQVCERHDHVWVFLHEYRALVGERRETFRRKRAHFEDSLAALFSAGVADGEFEIDNIQLTMLAFLSMHNYTYQWIRRSHSLDPSALSKLYCDIFFVGVASRGRAARG